MPPQIVGRAQQRPVLEEPRAARREHLVLQQRLDFEPGISPAAVADRDVEIAGAQIDDVVSRGNPHIDVRPALLEPVQPHDQPFGGKRGRGGDRQGAGVVMGAQPPDRGLYAGEGFRQSRQQYPCRGGQLDRTVEAVEQPDAEVLFQRMNLMADRGRGDVELVGGLAETGQPGGRFEGAQRAQGRQVAIR